MCGLAPCRGLIPGGRRARCLPVAARTAQPAAHQQRTCQGSLTLVGLHAPLRACSARQWSPGVIGADKTAAAGYRGAGARVAVLDGGIVKEHIDIAANLNQELSKDFVRDGTQLFWPADGSFSHGTHVSEACWPEQQAGWHTWRAEESTPISTEALRLRSPYLAAQHACAWRFERVAVLRTCQRHAAPLLRLRLRRLPESSRHPSTGSALR